jgi:futalosine hydrolase
MRIAICAATEAEIIPSIHYLQKKKTSTDKTSILHGTTEIFTLVTGVGAVATAVKCTQLFQSHKIDLAINAGIAGSFNRAFMLGDTCKIVKDRFGDLGTSHADGTFSDIYDMGLEDGDHYPFEKGWLIPKPSKHIGDRWPEVSAITVNKVTGHTSAIDEMYEKYNADFESMEGAGFFYASMLAGVDAMQIRAISNYVTPRDKSLWNIPLAIQRLNHDLIQIIDELAE